MNLHYLQHAPFERLARFRSWARRRGLGVAGTRLFAGEPLPAGEGIDLLVVLGGPMGVHDEPRHPWLSDEKRFMEGALGRGVKVLGVCLGAQLLAAVLGARVYPNRERELGWLPIELTEDGRRSPLGTLGRRRTVFQWHGDTFDLPRGGKNLAASVACEHQAFAHGDSVLGLQFHLEMTPAAVAEIIRNCPEDAGAGPFMQEPGTMKRLAPRYAPGLHAALDAMLDRWVFPKTCAGA